MDTPYPLNAIYLGGVGSLLTSDLLSSNPTFMPSGYLSLNSLGTYP